MNFIILADKFEKGTKTKGWIGSSPVNKRQTLIENQVSAIRKVFPKCKICYVYGFDHKKVEDYLYNKEFKNFVPIYNKHFEKRGECHSIASAADYLDSGSMITTGDMLLKPSNFNNFIDKNHLYLSPNNVDDLGCNINSSGKIEHIFYGLPNYIVNMYYIDRKNIEMFQQMICRNEYRNYFIFEIINYMIDKNIQFSLIKEQAKRPFKKLLQRN